MTEEQKELESWGMYKLIWNISESSGISLGRFQHYVFSRAFGVKGELV